MSDRMLEWLEQEKDVFCTFASDSAIVGFSYVVNSTTRLERWFFAVFTLLALAVTLYDITKTIEGYQAEGTSSSISRSNNRTFTLRPYTICLSYESSKINIEPSGAYFSSVSREFRTYIIKAQSRLAASQLNASTEIHNRLNILAITAKLFGKVVRLENSLSDHDELERLVALQLENETTDVFQLAHDFYVTHEMRGEADAEQLWRLLGKELCLAMKLNVSSIVHTPRGTQQTFVDVCDEKRVTWVGPAPLLVSEYVCLEISDERLRKFESIFDSVEIRLEPERLYRNTAVLEFASAYVDLNGEFVLTPWSENLLAIDYNAEQEVSIELREAYKLLDLKRRRCFGNRSTLSCEAACIATKVLQKCGCWPLSWQRLAERPANSVVCSSKLLYGSNSIYTKRTINKDCKLAFLDTLSKASKCWRQCLPPCDQMVFKGDNKGLTVHTTKGGPNATHVRLRVQNFAYSINEETRTVDYHTMLVTIGGNLGGSWAGISAIAILHLAVCCVKAIVCGFRKKKLGVEEEDQIGVDEGVQTNRRSSLPSPFEANDPMSRKRSFSVVAMPPVRREGSTVISPNDLLREVVTHTGPVSRKSSVVGMPPMRKASTVMSPDQLLKAIANSKLMISSEAVAQHILNSREYQSQMAKYVAEKVAHDFVKSEAQPASGSDTERKQPSFAAVERRQSFPLASVKPASISPSGWRLSSKSLPEGKESPALNSVPEENGESTTGTSKSLTERKESPALNCVSEESVEHPSNSHPNQCQGIVKCSRGQH